MKCPECKKEAADPAAPCPNCGFPMDANETALHIGAVTFTNVNLGDAVLAIGGALASGENSRRTAWRAMDNLGRNGHGVLTNKRFVFGSSGPLKKITEGSTVNLAKYRARGEIYFDIPLGDILSFSKGKQGFSTLFVLKTNDGEYKFALLFKSSYPGWEAAFNNNGFIHHTD